MEAANPPPYARLMLVDVARKFAQIRKHHTFVHVFAFEIKKKGRTRFAGIHTLSRELSWFTRN